MDHRPKVYVVDDDTALLRMLSAALEIMEVEVEVFSSAREFLTRYRPGPCECLVCDIRMPDIDGVELQRRLIVLPYAPPIIFLTGFAEVGVAVELMKHGAFDFVEKPFSVQSLLSKIQLALEHSRKNFAEFREQETKKARLALLTERERVVLNLVVEDWSSREIAEQLNISLRTVENHRTRLMEKLHVNSVVALVKLFR